MEFFGGQRDGGLATHLVAPVSHVLEIPPDLPADLRVLIEPLSVAVHGVARGAAQPGERAVVIGAGAIGLFTALVLRARGLADVVVAEPRASRRQRAVDLGFAVIDPGAEDMHAAVSRLVRPEGADCVFECVGSAATIGSGARGDAQGRPGRHRRQRPTRAHDRRRRAAARGPHADRGPDVRPRGLPRVDAAARRRAARRPPDRRASSRATRSTGPRRPSATPAATGSAHSRRCSSREAVGRRGDARSVSAEPLALVFVEGRELLLSPESAGFPGAACADGILSELTEENAARLRAADPRLAPRPLGLASSFGFGDRMGVATPGHVRALRSTGATVAPVLAQQSIRELERTGRTHREVLDAATWGALRAGWLSGYAADADHLKEPDDVSAAAAAGYTMYTLDPSDHVFQEADGLAVVESRASLRTASVATARRQRVRAPRTPAAAGRPREPPDRG